MRKVWNLLLFTFFVLCLFLFRPRQDVVFAAVDETQYIRLFETGMDFELCVEENYTFTGSYIILRDTVYLSYREHAKLASIRKMLPRKLYINEDASSIKASDGKAFSAKIYLDNRLNQYQEPSYSIRLLKNQDAKISGLGSNY